jgi:hypothetical protein
MVFTCIKRLARVTELLKAAPEDVGYLTTEGSRSFTAAISRSMSPRVL